MKARDQFCKEQLSLMLRWTKESDMTEDDILQGIEQALTMWFHNVMVCFEPDDSILDSWSNQDRSE